ILAALEPVFEEIVVTTNGSPRALPVDRLADLAVQRFGDERVVAAQGLPAALDTAVALAAEVGDGGEMVSGARDGVTGSVVTARALFGKEPAGGKAGLPEVVPIGILDAAPTIRTHYE